MQESARHTRAAQECVELEARANVRKQIRLSIRRLLTELASDLGELASVRTLVAQLLETDRNSRANYYYPGPDHETTTKPAQVSTT